MQFSGPRLQLIDVCVRDDHWGGSVTLFPCAEAPDDGVRDPGFFIVESLHQIDTLDLYKLP